MDARLVWETWRRILTSDELVERVLDPGGANAVAGLSAAENAVLADYAATPTATDTNIGMYRRGLVRNALAALSLVPLTRRLLHASGLDTETVAADYARSAGYADNGPNFWRIAGGFVFTEGPLWSPDAALLFSCPNTNVIYRWHPAGRVSVFRSKSGYSGIDIGRFTQPGSNGLNQIAYPINLVQGQHDLTDDASCRGFYCRPDPVSDLSRGSESSL